MNTPETVDFADLALSAPVLQAIKAIGYEQPSPIQAACIPAMLSGKDVLGTAQTGTGKTAAFALPVLSMLNTRSKRVQALVLAPTRELAIQVSEAFQSYASKIQGFQVLPVYGGQGMDTQLRQLKRGVQVVVGTPGRVMDHLRRGTLQLDALKTVVLDEADEMLRMGFIDDVPWILEQAPAERQVALFSATMPKPIRRIADQYLNDPEEIRIEGKTQTVDRIEQRYWQVSGTNKLDALTRMLEVESFDGVIMFARTKTATVELADKLSARGYAASAINGDMTQKLRERTIEQLKSGRVDILVATDVAARGIDVARVSHVINYDIPYDTEAYVHRIGRTGRAGRSGKAILFVAPRERRMLRAIEKATGQNITPMELPTREEVNKLRREQFKQQVVDTLAHPDVGYFQNMIQELLHEQSVDAEAIAAALALMAQKDSLLMPRKAKTESAPAAADKPAKRDKTEKRTKANSADERSGKAKKDTPEGHVHMVKYRVAVGHDHEVQPGDIVGAIANEAEIDSEFIGRIRIFEDHSVIELPDGMPEKTFQQLKQVWVRNQKLDIQRVDALRKRNGPKRKKPGNDGATEGRGPIPKKPRRQPPKGK